MEEVSPAEKEILAETAKLMRAGGSFEESLGKTVRRGGMDYSEYIRLASLVREKAKKENTSLDKAAARLARSDDEKKDDH